jgi:NADH-quinone oxidoreductase subunit E
MAMTVENIGFGLIDAIIHKHNVEKGAIIPILQGIQDTYGYIPQVAMERVSVHTGVGTGEIFGIVTFYNMFRLEPIGEHLIKVCHGTACHLLGAEKISDSLAIEVGAGEGETSPDGKFTVEHVRCIGCCSLAPCMMVDDTVHARLTPESVRKVINKIRAGEKEEKNEDAENVRHA